MAGDEGDEVKSRFLPLESDAPRFCIHDYYMILKWALTTFTFTFQGDQGPPGLPGPEEVIRFPPHSLTDSPPTGEKVMTKAISLYTYILCNSAVQTFSMFLSMFYRETKAYRDHAGQRALL